MAAPSKAQLLTEIQALLKKRYKPKPDKDQARLTILEAVVYAACREGTTREQANQALGRYKDDFFDWNEVRVSTVTEVQSALAGLPDAEPRAHRVRRFLRQLFEKTYGFNLEPLAKKPLKESLKALSEYEAFGSDYVEAVVVQHALGGHAIPVDAPALRVLTRLGVAEPDTEPAALRGTLERAIPKTRGEEFVDLIEDLAHDTCVEPEPDCPRCELRKLCPTAALLKEGAKTAPAAPRATAKDHEPAKSKSKEKSKSKDAPKEKPPEAPPAKSTKPPKGKSDAK